VGLTHTLRTFSVFRSLRLAEHRRLFGLAKDPCRKTTVEATGLRADSPQPALERVAFAASLFELPY